ncbi:LOW QUALITY PROTEIN: hypothetical protein T265_14530 [Opisthorchis viverrini]|uniref:Regulator of G protein signalling-like domain-containing protein n=1 Tax=Opisthorchis viverrini TaxID=6198 RepID=A0A075A8V2_OPIVI|nr:LOW QUALITY PROTEIN: hypothetical protein T265_14530 [Opisthorchis viverrini]KER23934.1 LOW QUALITY PROTEIN: hypothetical protein T265_14530 [Opisthorchis viverrini]
MTSCTPTTPLPPPSGHVMGRNFDDESDDDLHTRDELMNLSNLFSRSSVVLNSPERTGVFINYLLMQNMDLAPSLFFLVNRYYQRAVLSSKELAKDYRRLCLEIFSTFMHPKSPLHLDLPAPVIQEISQQMRQSSSVDQCFASAVEPALNLVQNQLNKLCREIQHAVSSFRCLAAMPPDGSTRVEILPGYPSLDKERRETEIEFEPWTFRSVNSRSNLLGHWVLVRFPKMEISSCGWSSSMLNSRKVMCGCSILIGRHHQRVSYETAVGSFEPELPRLRCPPPKEFHSIRKTCKKLKGSITTWRPQESVNLLCARNYEEQLTIFELCLTARLQALLKLSMWEPANAQGSEASHEIEKIKATETYQAIVTCLVTAHRFFAVKGGTESADSGSGSVSRSSLFASLNKSVALFAERDNLIVTDSSSVEMTSSARCDRAASLAFFGIENTLKMSLVVLVVSEGICYLSVLRAIKIELDSKATPRTRGLGSGYLQIKWRQLRRVLVPLAKPNKEWIGTAVIPYKAGTSEVIRRVLNTANRGVVFQRGNTLRSALVQLKDRLRQTGLGTCLQHQL